MNWLATTVAIVLAAGPAATKTPQPSRDEGVLSVRGDGADNRVRAEERRNTIVIRDSAGTLAASPATACEPRPGGLVCARSGIQKLALELGGGDDRATIEGAGVEGIDVSVEGGSGAERIDVDTSGSIAIGAGAGADRVRAAVTGEFSSVVVSGNGGDDALTNRGLPSIAISNFYGNQGADRLIGSDADDDLLDGGSGADLLIGGGGNDTLLARDEGADQVLACDEGDPATAGTSDRAVLDALDPEPSGCESVDRP